MATVEVDKHLNRLSAEAFNGALKEFAPALGCYCCNYKCGAFLPFHLHLHCKFCFSFTTGVSLQNMVDGGLLISKSPYDCAHCDNTRLIAKALYNEIDGLRELYLLNLM